VLVAVNRFVVSSRSIVPSTGLERVSSTSDVTRGLGEKDKAFTPQRPIVRRCYLSNSIPARP